jgi:hypothetical protein
MVMFRGEYCQFGEPLLGILHQSAGMLATARFQSHVDFEPLHRNVPGGQKLFLQNGYYSVGLL